MTRRGIILAALLLACGLAWAAQTLVPTGDVTTGGWTTTPLWAKLALDDADSTAIQTGNNPSNDLMRVSMTDPSTPVGSGTNTLNVKCRKDSTGGRRIDVTIRAKESTTTLGSQTQTDIGNTYTTITTTFTSPGTWANLEVEIEGNAVGGGGPRKAVCTYAEAVIPDATAGGRDLMVLTAGD